MLRYLYASFCGGIWEIEFYRAIFIRRNNRFEVECLLDGRIVKAYLPNPGRLWEILLPGKEIYLKRETGARKNAFTVWAASRYGTPVLLHTHYSNTVAEQVIKEGLIPELRRFGIEEREVIVNHSRIDFLLRSKDGKRFFLEVKSCTLFGDDIAMFPDAVTDRGKRHIETLAEVTSQESNILSGILFLVHAGHVRRFLPDFHTDPAFSRVLYENRHRLLVKALSVKWDRDLQPFFGRLLDIPWQIYEKEARDRGSYLLVGMLPENISLRVKSLGERFFRKGFYIYVGSAMNSLSQRIRRHLIRKKPTHWHIDTLTPWMKSIIPLRIEASQRLECAIARSLHTVSDSAVRNFGSSDCTCPSHLFWMASNPFCRESFIKILIDFRINRLSQLHQDSEPE